LAGWVDYITFLRYGIHANVSLKICLEFFDFETFSLTYSIWSS